MPKQAKAERDGVIYTQNYNYNKLNYKYNKENFDAFKRYESTEVDQRTAPQIYA